MAAPDFQELLPAPQITTLTQIQLIAQTAKMGHRRSRTLPSGARRKGLMRHVWKLAAVAALALITSPTSASAQGVDQNTRQQIERIVATYVENFNKQEAAGIASLYTKDGVLVTRSEKAVKVGPQEIEQSTQDLFKMGYNHDKAGLDQVSPVGTDAAIS